MPEKIYTLHIHPKVSEQLQRHAEFIARISKPAAIRFRNDFQQIVHEITSNPFMFPADQTIPVEGYQRALFGKWYKAVFYVDGNSIYLDAVVDCRQEISANW